MNKELKPEGLQSGLDSKILPVMSTAVVNHYYKFCILVGTTLL